MVSQQPGSGPGGGKRVRGRGADRPDVIWHVPGDDLISGTYTSRDGIFGCFSKIFELSGGSYQPQLPDILPDDNHMVALLHANARHGEKVLDQIYLSPLHTDWLDCTGPGASASHTRWPLQ
jgi:hypothetical protein